MFEILDQTGTFGRVHHRFLNDREKLLALRSHCSRHQGYSEIAEGDVCWLEDNGSFDFFMMHPPPFNRLPAAETIRKVSASGEISTLRSLLDEDVDQLLFMIEIKVGTGSTRGAMEALLKLLQSRIPGRYCLDCFSPSVLKMIKEISPSTATSLHTRLGVYGRFVVKTAFEMLPFLPLDLYRLSSADAITVTYKYSPARYLRALGATVDSVHRHVRDAGKRLIFGGVETESVLRDVEDSSATAAYPKFCKAEFAIPYEAR